MPRRFREHSAEYVVTSPSRIATFQAFTGLRVPVIGNKEDIYSLFSPETTSKLRPPSMVLRPARLGAAAPTELSVAASLLRRMCRDGWRIHRARFDLDDEGCGTVIYEIAIGRYLVKFLVFSMNAEGVEKVDRAWNTNWDASGFLCYGDLDDARIDRIRMGFRSGLWEERLDAHMYGWTRVNRSERSFRHIVDALASGSQPDVSLLQQVGYLVRNAGFRGNGKHGSASFSSVPAGHPFSHPYYMEMLALFLWREYAADLANHLARARNKNSAELAPRMRRYIGVGNSSGLGLVLYPVNHPLILDRWIGLRELALASARTIARPTRDELQRLLATLDRRAAYFESALDEPGEVWEPPAKLAMQLRQTAKFAREAFAAAERDEGEAPWDRLIGWAESSLRPEAVELVCAALIALYPNVVELLDDYLAVDESEQLHGAMQAAELHAIIDENYGWLADLARADTAHYFYYSSREGREPRLGVTAESSQDLLRYAQFAEVGAAIALLRAALAETDPATPVAVFLCAHPEHYGLVKRVQSIRDLRYAEIHGSLTSGDFTPVWLTRTMLALMGFDRFDPRSTLWLRGTVYAGAPVAADLPNLKSVEDWMYPPPPDSGTRQKAACA